jgi:hypothetical protein
VYHWHARMDASDSEPGGRRDSVMPVTVTPAAELSLVYSVNDRCPPAGGGRGPGQPGPGNII